MNRINPQDSSHEDRRGRWKQNRASLKERVEKSTPVGIYNNRKPDFFDYAIMLFGASAKFLGLYGRGMRNAMDIRLNAFHIDIADLPDELDGYRILHLTDFHLDKLPGLEDVVVEAIKGCSYDLCVMTGDYQHCPVPLERTLAPMEKITNAINAADGIYATLGNHDDHRLAEGLERLGIRVLVNETAIVNGNGRCFRLTGLDDVHTYFSPMAAQALTQSADTFAIALVHSPEMADEAAAKGYSLYLCGHTHGGQICLPGGVPVVTRLKRNKGYYAGLWKCGKMTGYTSPGAGVSGIPLRFFSRGEAAVITLRKTASA